MSKGTDLMAAVVSSVALLAMSAAAPALTIADEPAATPAKSSHGGGETLKQDMKDAGNSVAKTAKKVGHATAEGVHKAAKATAHGVGKAGHAVEHAAEKTEAKLGKSDAAAKNSPH